MDLHYILKLSGRGRQIAGAVIAATALVACGSSSPSASGSPGSISGKKVILVACGDVNPWCKVYNHTILDTLQAAGVQTTYLEDVFDPAVQVQHLQSAIAQHPDLILVVATNDKSIVPSLARAKDQHVPVININGRADDASIPLLTSSILADQTQLGRYAAQNIIEGLKRQGRVSANVIAITGTAGTNTAQDRMRGFNEVMGTAPQYKVVEVQDGNWDQVLSSKLAQELFAKYQNQGGIGAAYGMADYMAAGIIQAAQQSGIPLGVKVTNGLIVTGSNCFKVGIDNIIKGLQYGTATQAPGDEGNYVASVVTKFLSGQQIPKTNINHEDRVTVDNVQQYVAACTKA